MMFLLGAGRSVGKESWGLLLNSATSLLEVKNSILTKTTAHILFETSVGRETIEGRLFSMILEFFTTGSSGLVFIL